MIVVGNGREFHTIKQRIRASLGINYIMSIDKIPTTKSYWECGQFIGNEGIGNDMAISTFEYIFRNLHFSDNTKDDKSDKVRSFINLFNQRFSNSVSNDDYQSIHEHMLKFKGQSNMKQYVKNKPIVNRDSRFGIALLVKQDTSINLTSTWLKKKALKKIRHQALF